MATDPITGLTLEGGDRTQDVLDYLGRKAPLGLAQQSAMPSVGGAAPGSAPASAGGTGVPSPSDSGVSAGFGQNAFSPDIPGLGEQLGRAAAGQILGQAKGRAQGLLNPSPGAGTVTGDFNLLQGAPVSGSGPTMTFPSDFASSLAPISSESVTAPAGAFTGAEASGPVSTELGASLGSEAASAAAGGIGSNLLGPLGLWSGAYDLGKLGLSLGGIKGGETTGNQWGDMAVGLLGGPVADPLKGLIGSFTGPSNAWQQFGGKLSGTLYGESSAINTLLPWLGKAQTQGDIGQSLDMFRQLVETGAGVGGYQLGKPTDLGAPQIGALPGATGTRHEGGLTADFGPVTTAMNNYIAALYAALPPGGPSGTMTYESFAAGMSPDELGNFTRLAQQGMALPADQQQAFVAQSGLDPQRQDQLLRYIGNPLSPGNERMLYQPDVGGPGDGGGDGGGGI